MSLRTRLVLTTFLGLLPTLFAGITIGFLLASPDARAWTEDRSYLATIAGFAVSMLAVMFWPLPPARTEHVIATVLPARSMIGDKP